MGSFLNLHSFYFVLIFTCSFLEIYGKGFGGGRGGYSSRGSGYSSRGSSSTGGSYGSKSSGNYKSSSSGSSKSSSSSNSGSSSSGSGSYRSSSSSNQGSKSSGSSGISSSGTYRSRSGTYGSGANLGNSYGTIYRPPLYNNRMYGSYSGSDWSNFDDDDKSQENYARKIKDSENRKYESSYKPPTTAHYTSHGVRKNEQKKSEVRNQEYSWRIHREPQMDPFHQRYLNELEAKSEEMRKISNSMLNLH